VRSRTIAADPPISSHGGIAPGQYLRKRGRVFGSAPHYQSSASLSDATSRAWPARRPPVQPEPPAPPEHPARLPQPSRPRRPARRCQLQPRPLPAQPAPPPR